VQFSPCGTYLASVGEDDSHSLGIWKWEDAKPGKECKSLIQPQTVSKAEVYGLIFNAHRNPAKPDQKDEKAEEAAEAGGEEDEEEKKEKVDAPILLEFVAYGAKQIKFFCLYHMENDKAHPYKVTSHTASPYKATKVVQKFFSSAAWTDKTHCAVGTETGHVYMFAHQKFKKQIQAHESTVGALVATADGCLCWL